MEGGCLYGIIDTEPAGACRANDIPSNGGLRGQEPKNGFQVGFLFLDLSGLFAYAAALAIAAGVDCERVNVNRRQLPGHIVPGSARTVALMVEDHAGDGLARSKISCL